MAVLRVRSAAPPLGSAAAAHHRRLAIAGRRLALPGRTARRSRAGVLLRGRAHQGPVAAHRLALRWKVSTPTPARPHTRTRSLSANAYEQRLWARSSGQVEACTLEKVPRDFPALHTVGPPTGYATRDSSVCMRHPCALHTTVEPVSYLNPKSALHRTTADINRGPWSCKKVTGLVFTMKATVYRKVLQAGYGAAVASYWKALHALVSLRRIQFVLQRKPRIMKKMEPP